MDDVKLGDLIEDLIDAKAELAKKDLLNSKGDPSPFWLAAQKVEGLTTRLNKLDFVVPRIATGG